MKDLRALAQKIKIIPGSVEEPLTGKGESVRESPSLGNTVCAGKIPCQKQNTVWDSMDHSSGQGKHICNSCEAFEKKVPAMPQACENMAIQATCKNGEKK